MNQPRSLTFTIVFSRAETIAPWLLVIPMFYLGKALFNRGVGFGASLLFQCLPVSARATTDALSEGLFLLLATTALLCAVVAAARGHGVLPDLAHEWDRIGPGMASAQADILRAAPKAWRFAGEMHEIAATFRGAGLPGGFHEAAAEVYERLAAFKDHPEPPAIESVLEALLKGE